MEVLEGLALRKQMLGSYSKDPKGWSFVVSPSRSGIYDATVSGPDGAWMLKIDSVFKPSPIVIGSPAETFPIGPGRRFPYGYRNLPPDLALQVLGGEVSRESTLAGLLSLLKSEPVVPEVGGSYAEGPLVLTGPREVTLSESQKEIDSRPASEMRRLLKLRYPAYG